MGRAIVLTNDTCVGEPRLEGTRLTCGNIVSLLEGIGFGSFFETYAYLTEQDVANALSYCANQQCLVDKVPNFCQRCSLDKREAESCGTSEFRSDPKVQMYDKREQLRDMWLLAQEILRGVLPEDLR